MAVDRLKVIVSDAETGEVLGEQVIYDDYCLVTAGSCYLDSQAVHANGTHQLVIKGSVRGPR